MVERTDSNRIKSLTLPTGRTKQFLWWHVICAKKVFVTWILRLFETRMLLNSRVLFNIAASAQMLLRLGLSQWIIITVDADFWQQIASRPNSKHKKPGSKGNHKYKSKQCNKYLGRSRSSFGRRTSCNQDFFHIRLLQPKRNNIGVCQYNL